MFGNINGTWLDGAFFNILRYIDGMHLFFMKQVTILAKICFVLSFGISCVKMLMGATELNKVLTQAFMSIAAYFIMIFMFPHIMLNMQKIISDLSYGAVFSQGFNVALDGKYGRQDDFFHYLNEIGSDKNGNTVWTVGGEAGANKTLNLQITHKETGLISLNKVFQMIIATFKALWKSLDVGSVFDFFKHLPDFLMIIAIGLGYLWALSVAIVQYAMTVVQYTFLYGAGALFIPLMLWEGTKHAFEKLCGSIFNIGVRLLVVQITLYLAVMANMDVLKNMFILSSGKIDFLQGLEFYLSVAFMVVFIKLFVDQAPAIADFLCGGQPRLSFGDFARAAASGAAAGMAAAKVGGTMVKGAATTGVALAGAAGAAVASGRGAASSERAQGGSIGGSFMAGMASFGKSIGQSAKQGGANILDNGIEAIAKAPQSARDFGQFMKHGIDPSTPLPRKGTAHNSGEKPGKETEKITEGERLMQSKNMSERVKGMGELYKEKRAQGGEYSGLDGRFKALKSSIGEFHGANQKAAPGITEEDRLRKTAKRLISMGDSE
ncbi:MAG: type IV secretion system protein [Treponema sp.]|jgi:type IV secretory pathway TrbL component|nr:type IV secretion system protein [Treponema sp.]